MRIATVLRLGLVVSILAALPLTAFAGSKDEVYQTAFMKWTGPDLAGFEGKGVDFTGSELVFLRKDAVQETDLGNMYNKGTY